MHIVHRQFYTTCVVSHIKRELNRLNRNHTWTIASNHALTSLKQVCRPRELSRIYKHELTRLNRNCTWTNASNTRVGLTNCCCCCCCCCCCSSPSPSSSSSSSRRYNAQHVGSFNFRGGEAHSFSFGDSSERNSFVFYSETLIFFVPV